MKIRWEPDKKYFNGSRMFLGDVTGPVANTFFTSKKDKASLAKPWTVYFNLPGLKPDQQEWYGSEEEAKHVIETRVSMWMLRAGAE